MQAMLESYSRKLKKLSDKELYALCKKYGLETRLTRRRFAGLLPEVFVRRLYKKRGHAGIHEFAAKLAGMSKETVDKILCMAKNLEDKPCLREQLVSGSEGWSKIERVAYIATPETDEFWAEKVSSLTQLALEAFVQEARKQDWIRQNNRLEFTLKSETQAEKMTAEGPSLFPGKPLPAVLWSKHLFPTEKTSVLTFHVRPALEGKFRMFKHLLEKQRREPLTFEDALEALLDGSPLKAPTVHYQVCPNCVGRAMVGASPAWAFLLH